MHRYSMLYVLATVAVVLVILYLIGVHFQIA